MQEFPDDNQMDELFRKSAEAFEPPYDPTAWQDMAARLDRHDQPVPSPWLRRGLAILLLLWLTGNYGWFSSSRPVALSVAGNQQRVPIAKSQKINQHTDNQSRYSLIIRQREPNGTGSEQPNRANSQPAETPVNAANTVLPTLPRSMANQESAITTPRVTPGIRPTRPGADQLTVTKTPRIGQSTTRITNPANALAVRPNAYQSPEKRNREMAGKAINRRDNRTKNAFAFSRISPVLASGGAMKTILPGRNNDAKQLIPATPISESPDSKLLENGELTTAQSSVFQTITLLPIRDKLTDLGRNRLTDSMAESPIAVIPPDTAQTLPVVRPIRPLRFVVGAVFSPDLSTIGLRNFDRPGTNFGLSVQYQFSKRWSVQTGILQSQKNYRALPSQYQLPPNVYWGVWPSSISAVCRMIDVPINVRYDVFLRPHPTGLFSSARWFVSAGATAYWISRETYQYNYANPNDPRIKQRNKETSTGRQGISNLNVSVGYERQLNRRFSVQVEPFLKMPLRGIGAYKIRLVSTGVFMSVRYRF
jgi:hypothetical protein